METFFGVNSGVVKDPCKVLEKPCLNSAYVNIFSTAVKEKRLEAQPKFSFCSHSFFDCHANTTQTF